MNESINQVPESPDAGHPPGLINEGGPRPGDVLKAADMPMAMALMGRFQSIGASGTINYFTMFDQVRQFRAVADQYIGDIATDPTKEEVVLLDKIIHEEVNLELMPLLEKAKRVPLSLSEKAQLLDHVVDSIYVLLSVPAVFGLPFDQAFSIVQNANMAKIPVETGPIKNEYGKIMKPEGWQAPDLHLLQLCQGLYNQVRAQQERQLKMQAQHQRASQAGADSAPPPAGTAANQ